MNIILKLFELLKLLFKTSADAAVEDTVVIEPEEEPKPAEPEVVEGEPINVVSEEHCEQLICKKCGKEYNSSGLHDIGICKECLEKENFIGGPLGS